MLDIELVNAQLLTTVFTNSLDSIYWKLFMYKWEEIILLCPAFVITQTIY